MGKTLRTLCVSLLTLFGLSCVNTAFVTIHSSVATLGNNHHNVTCDYSISDEEIFVSIAMYEIIDGSEKQLATLYGGRKHPRWYPGVSHDIKSRAVLIHSWSSTSLQIHFKNTVCGDEKTYICLLRFLDSQEKQKVQHSEANNVTITASPFTKAVNVTTTSSNATVGNTPHHIQCDYSLGADDRFQSLSMFWVVSGKDVPLAIFDFDMKYPVWDLNVSRNIKQRATILQPDGSRSLQIYFYNTLCSDEKHYKCQLTFRHGEHIEDIERTQMTMVSLKDAECVENSYATITSSVGVLGDNPHYVQCDSHVAAGEKFIRIEICEIVNGKEEIIAGGYSNWAGISDFYVRRHKNRVALFLPNGVYSIQLYFKDTVCSDAKLYRCRLTVRTRVPNIAANSYSETIPVSIEASVCLNHITG